MKKLKFWNDSIKKKKINENDLSHMGEKQNPKILKYFIQTMEVIGLEAKYIKKYTVGSKKIFMSSKENIEL